jgi:hypothetical protein
LKSFCVALEKIYLETGDRNLCQTVDAGSADNPNSSIDAQDFLRALEKRQSGKAGFGMGGKFHRLL